MINEQRPALARKEDPGMPSSHANSLAFLSTYRSVLEVGDVSVDCADCVGGWMWDGQLKGCYWVDDSEPMDFLQFGGG